MNKHEQIWQRLLLVFWGVCVYTTQYQLERCVGLVEQPSVGIEKQTHHPQSPYNPNQVTHDFVQIAPCPVVWEGFGRTSARLNPILIRGSNT